MPFYSWKDKNTNVEVEVLRAFSNYDNPPSYKEVDDQMTEEQYGNAEWERLIKAGGMTITFNNKGNW
jgi:predicted nucleic acid-binding Zn ribbon protein